MLISRCQRIVVRAAAAALALCVTVSSAAVAIPSKPGRPGGFRLFANTTTVFTANRVQCGIFSDGGICVGASSTVGGGFWPRGTANQYVFGSGINIAGIIEPGDRSVNGFAGDTAGGFFNNTAGGNNGTEVRPIFDSNDPDDVAVWPEEAKVPQGDASENLFDPTLRGAVAASQGDLWFVSWEGDPSQLASRAHPLGIAVETRVMAWNFPAGNEDIMYVIYTFYNITSTDPAAYANVRPSLRPILLETAEEFHAKNTARYGINLPAHGYTISDFFAAFTADMDVANANTNYASVNVPFALGYTYENVFSNAAAAAIGWTFDPAIFGSAPFFPGVGFIGVKYLGSPINPDTQEEVGLTLFGTFSRSSGSLQDPNDDKQLYRYISGGLTPADGSCSIPNPLQSKICFVNISSPADMRFFQSSGPIDLKPGDFGSITVAYIFAAPVTSPGCPGVGCDVKPANNNADLTILGDPVRMAAGVNQIDVMTGYLGNNNADPTRVPADPDPTRVTQDEFLTVPGSLLGKAKVAQSVFDFKFLLPFAPDRPEFFLVPGDNQTTILWSPSPTEDPNNPDAFFQVASQPLVEGAPNALYDPNFRGNDVEGYRIYRGRTSNPSELTMIAQFDYGPDASGAGRGIFTDFRGTVNPTPACAPELGVNNLTGCGVVLSTPGPGEAFTASRAIDLTGTITQVIPGNRVLLANGTAQILPGALDTAFAEIARGRVGQGVSTQLANTGVPFIFVDRGVRNSLRYFYAVTAFDVNSVISGPSSLESARTTKAVTPVPSPSNQTIKTTVARHVEGRGVATDELFSPPTIDGATGRFSGPAAPSDGGVVEFVGEFAGAVIQPDQGGELSMTLDSLKPGQMDTFSGFAAGSAGFPTTYYLTLKSPSESFKVTVPFQQLSAGFGTALVEADTSTFTAVVVKPEVATHFEGAPPFQISAFGAVQMPNVSFNGGWGDGCRGGDIAVLAGASVSSSRCAYNGDRWFEGPSPTRNETKADPNGGNCAANPGGSGSPINDPAQTVPCNLAEFNNAGELPGVDIIQQAMEYIQLPGAWRNASWVYGTVHRGADYNVYWGDTPGVIDSVIDVTHNVMVPFSPTIGASWGILNTANAGLSGGADGRATVLTQTDIGCVEPFATQFSPGMDQRIPCSSVAALEPNASLGSVAFFKNSLAEQASAPVSGTGFMIYVVGSQFLMQMTALPAKPTVWALRTYSGAITGGKGPGIGDTGQPYRFFPAVSPFTAVGATVKVQFTVENTVAPAVKNDLSRVHTVPDPYYVKSAYEASTEQKILKFVGLPQDAIIRIYSASGVLIRMLEHHGGEYSSTSRGQGSEFDWDLRNRNNQVVASGVYFFHVESGGARKVGRFTVVNFAQ